MCGISSIDGEFIELFRELTQVRTTTTVRNNLNFRRVAIFNEHFMTFRKVQSFKNNCSGYFEV